MKHFSIFIFTVVFLLAGLGSAAAQDLIVLKDGNIIEAKVTEISPTEIRYLRSDRLDGPVIVVPAAGVLGIRYEDGAYEVINAFPAAGAAPAAAAGQENTRAERKAGTALDPDKFTFAVSANPVGIFIPTDSFETGVRGGGSSFCLEAGKGKFNTEIHFIFPGLSIWYDEGFGALLTLNYFKHRWNGGFYVGGGVGFASTSQLWITNNVSKQYREEHLFTFGLNIGYKFVTKSGVYFRMGTYAGISFVNWTENWTNGFAAEHSGSRTSAYFKPDLAIGYTFASKPAAAAKDSGSSGGSEPKRSDAWH